MRAACVEEGQRKVGCKVGVVLDLSDVLGRDGLRPFGEEALAAARTARGRLAAAFRGDDPGAASWFEQPAEPGTVRVFFVPPGAGATVFVTWRADHEPVIDHTSPIDWEPYYWASSTGAQS